MRLLYFLSLIFISFSSYAQESVRIENGQPYDSLKFSPVLQKLHQQYDYLILFRITQPGKAVTNYFILARKSDQLHAFEYNPSAGKEMPKNLSRTNLEMIWKNLIQNDLFSLKNEKDVANFCALKYHIYDSYTYEFTLISKSKMKVLSYYNPEYYDEVCYGLPERKRIINIASAYVYYWK